MINAPPLEETARWGRNWQVAPDWESHTVLRSEADRIAAGYVSLLEGLAGELRGKKGLGIGSGAGHLEAALADYGINMVASEWSDEGVHLIKSQNPTLRCQKVDLMTFADTDTWGIIVCRELYPFTRTNAYTQQLEILHRLINALQPGGVLILSGSDVSRPQCLDYDQMARELRTDPRVAELIGPILEPVLKRICSNPFGRLGYRLQNAIAERVLRAVNRFRYPKIAGIRVYAFRKSTPSKSI